MNPFLLDQLAAERSRRYAAEAERERLARLVRPPRSHAWMRRIALWVVAVYRAAWRVPVRRIDPAEAR